MESNKTGIEVVEYEESDTITSPRRDTVNAGVDSIEQENYVGIHTVESVSQKFNVAFYHGIGTNNLYIRGDWKVRLHNLLINKNANIATSSLQQGDGPQNIARDFGVVLAKGEITEAHAFNAITNIGDQEVSSDLSIDIEDAIINRDSNSLNELKIKGIRIAGICINTKQPILPDRQDDVPPNQEVYDESERLGIPVFCFIDGSFYIARFDADSNMFIPDGDPISPMDFANKGYSLLDSHYEEIIEEFRHNIPYYNRPKSIAEMRKLHDEIRKGRKVVDDSLVLKTYGQSEDEIDDFVQKNEKCG